MKRIVVTAGLILTLFISNTALSQVVYPCGTYYVNFNGINYYGRFSNCFGTTGITGDFTLSAWIRLTDPSFAGKEMDIFHRQVNGFSPSEGTDGINLYISTDGSIKFRAYIRKGGSCVLDSMVCGPAPDPFKWYYIAVTFRASDGTCNAYVNGVLSGSASFGGDLNRVYPYLDYLAIGKKEVLNRYEIITYKGDMDELAFCAKELTSDEVKTLANGLVPGSPLITTYKITDYDKLDNYPGGVNSGIGNGQVGVYGQLYKCTNKPPLANAGPDQTITLPTNSVTLDGTGSADPDGSIVKYQWTKISGPASGGGIVADAQNVVTSVGTLNEGIYVFQLTVTDNSGANASARVTITVNSKSNYINVANLRVFADNIPPPSTNPRTVSGNIYITPRDGCSDVAKVMHLSGNVVVDTVQNTISGDQAIYFAGVNNADYYLDQGKYNLHVADNVLTWDLNAYDVFSNLFSLFNFKFKVSNIRVFCDGVHLKTELGLPKWVYLIEGATVFAKKYGIDVDSLFLTPKGIDFKGGVHASNLTFRNIFGIDNLELNYNSLEHSFEGNLRITTELFNIDGSTKWISGNIDEIKLGIASNGLNYLRLPFFPAFGIDSAGGGIAGLYTPPLKLSAGLRISPAVGFTIPSFANLVVQGEYAFGTSFKGGATFSFFGTKVYGASITYSKGLFQPQMNLELSYFPVKIKGAAQFSIYTQDTWAKLNGTASLNLEIPEFESGWLKYLNKLYPAGEYLSSSNYFTNSYFTGTAKLPLLPRLFYIIERPPDWKAHMGTSSSIVPLEAQKQLSLRRAQTAKVSDKNYLMYSFSLDSASEDLIVQAAGQIPPALSLYVLNGDSITVGNYNSHKNVFYVSDSNSRISTYVIKHPLQGTYYVWSTNADSIRVSKTKPAPKISISNVVNDRFSKKLYVTYHIADAENSAYILFGLDKDKINTNGIILADSLPANNSTIVLDYATVPSGTYYLYTSIVDSLRQEDFFYDGSPFTAITNGAPDSPSNLTVSSTDSSLLISFTRNNIRPLNYLVHYTTDNSPVTLNTPNFAIGDTNQIELFNLSAGKTYQFAITALDSMGRESDLSNSVSLTWNSKIKNNAPSFKMSVQHAIIKVGESFSKVFSASDPDGDPLIFTLVKGPSAARISNNGLFTWIPQAADIGYNDICVKVADPDGGTDSIWYQIGVYQPKHSQPIISMDKPSYKSYNEKPFIEVTDFLQQDNGTVSVRVFSTSDPKGIVVSLLKKGDKQADFIGDFTLTKNQSGPNSIKVSIGDTINVEYANATSAFKAANYALFNYLKADFLFKDSICASDTVQFYNAAKGTDLQFHWDFGDNSISSRPNPTHLFGPGNGSTEYKVKLVVSNRENAIDSISKTITVLQAPIVLLSPKGPLQLCSGYTDTLFSSSKSNQWFRNDTLIPNYTGKLYVVDQAGRYSARTTSNGCTGTSEPVIVSFDIGPSKPVISASGPLNFCVGDSIELTSSSSTGNQWYRNDTLVQGATANTYAVKKSGNYSVQVKSGSCSSPLSSSITILVNTPPSPSVSASGPTTLCEGSNVQLKADTTYNSYQWFKDGNAITNATSRTYFASQAGNYTVSVGSNGCTAISQPITLTVTTNTAKPTITSYGPSSFCADSSVTLMSSATTGNQWYRNDTLINGAIATSYKATIPGIYTVKANMGTCSNVVSQPVTVSVIPLPTGSIQSSSLQLCPSKGVTLTASGGTSYEWYFNNTPVAGASGNTLNATRAGTYSATIINNGCRAKAQNQVTLNLPSKPSVTFSFDSYCKNQPVLFVNNSPDSAVTYQWTFGDGFSSSNKAPTHVYNQVGTFKVTLVESLKSCPEIKDSVTKNIAIQEPKAGIKYPVVQASVGSSVQLAARSIGKNYMWKPSTDLNNAHVPNPLLTVISERLYLVEITSDAGCVTVDTLQVMITKGSRIDVPKAFTPNGDGLNDVLRPIVQNLVSLKFFRVYNRWGQLVFETKTIGQGWDGTFNGERQPVETYTWAVEGIDTDGKALKASGKSLLIR